MRIMSRVKRGVARVKIAQRKRDEKKIQTLTLQRNKAIREANQAVTRAKLIEDRKDAIARRNKATGPSRKSIMAQQLMRGAAQLTNDIRGPKPRRRAKSTRRR